VDTQRVRSIVAIAAAAALTVGIGAAAHPAFEDDKAKPVVAAAPATPTPPTPPSPTATPPQPVYTPPTQAPASQPPTPRLRPATPKPTAQPPTVKPKPPTVVRPSTPPPSKPPAPPTTPAAVKPPVVVAKPVTGGLASWLAQAGIPPGAEQTCMNNIVQRESGGNPLAVNASSGAYGLGQALPASKMAPFGADYRTNPVTQLRWMRSYVNATYGGACPAWAFWQSHHWY